MRRELAASLLRDEFAVVSLRRKLAVLSTRCESAALLCCATALRLRCELAAALLRGQFTVAALQTELAVLLMRRELAALCSELLREGRSIVAVSSLRVGAAHGFSLRTRATLRHHAVLMAAHETTLAMLRVSGATEARGDQKQTRDAVLHGARASGENSRWPEASLADLSHP